MENPLEELERRMQGKNISEIARRANMARDNVARIARGEADDIYISTAVGLYRVLGEMEASE